LDWLKRNRIFREIVRIVTGDAEPHRLAWQGAHAGQSFRHHEPHRAGAARSAPPPMDWTSMHEENLHIACASYQAYVDKDRVAIEALIADDFHFTSPLDNRIDRRTYFERCWPNSRTTSGFEFVHLAADGDCVFVTYEAESTTGKRFRNTEVMTIRNGKIREVEVFFGWNVPHDAKVGGFVEKAA
jgi:ketosteroid isomerase-like protein